MKEKEKRKQGQQEKLLRADSTPMRFLRAVKDEVVYAADVFVNDPKRSPFAPKTAQQAFYGAWKFPNSAKERRRYRARIQRALDRLVDKKLVRMVETENGTEIHITKQGTGIVRRADLEDGVRIKKRVWDGKWRIVLFDVPETKRVARNALRTVLDNAGFYQLQKSVFIAPYPCEKQVMAVADYFEVGECVTCAEASKIGRQEARARKHFGLK